MTLTYWRSTAAADRVGATLACNDTDRFEAFQQAMDDYWVELAGDVRRRSLSKAFRPQRVAYRRRQRARARRRRR